MISLFLLSNSDAAIDIIFDYSYDTGNYFGDEQRYIMEQVAYVFESRMGGESFASTNPSDYGLNAGSGFNTYLSFTNPTTGANVTPAFGSTTSDGNVIGQANELVIFLGARSLAGATLATAGETGMGYGGTASSEATSWINALNSRDTTTNFDPRAGSSQVNTNKTFYFDTDLTTHNDAVTSGKVDFYSVMVHEIGHVMGFNDHNAWNAKKSGNFWTGANAKAEYNGQNVPLYSTPHWDLLSPSGSLNSANINCACHPSMLPSITINKRTSFSDLDFALLKETPIPHQAK